MVRHLCGSLVCRQCVRYQVLLVWITCCLIRMHRALTSRSFPLAGVTIYHDRIANERFISLRRLWKGEGATPVLNLPYLIDHVRAGHGGCMILGE